tara:strand:+ start:550 stop:768 length:219 start_codon:yes stop_codon:yes gene_type:complete
MRHFKILSVLLLTGIITACGGGTSAPSEYMVKVYPIENDFDRFETVGPVSSRDACAAKAMEMKAAAYECQPN